MPSAFTVTYSEHLPDLLQESRAEFEREARLAMAAKLFETGRLSSGQAAELAGLGRVEFLLGLRRLGVAMIDLDDQDLATDIQHA